MARFLILIYGDEQPWREQTPETLEALAQHRAFTQAHGDAILAGQGLQWTSTATSVRRDGDTVTVTDGPFAEVKEALGGFYLVEADDLDAATALAREIPSPAGGLEVRPVQVFA